MESKKPADLETSSTQDILGPINEMTSAIAQRLETIPQVDQVLSICRESSGFKNEHIILIVLGVCLWLCFFLSGLALIISAVAWGYPLYRSVCAIEEEKNQEKWLMYWVVYALVSTFYHTIGDYFLFWIPFYNPLKLVTYLALWHPISNGAEKIFGKLISPYLNMA